MDGSGSTEVGFTPVPENDTSRGLRKTTSMDDINADIEANEKALKSRSSDDQDRAICLNDLGDSFIERFRRTESMGDLEAAIEHSKEAVKLSISFELDDWSRVICLDTHGSALGERFQKDGSIDDLQGKIEAFDEIVTLIPADHPDRAMYLDILGCTLSLRFQHMGSTGNVADLDAMIEKHEEAVQLTPKDDENRTLRLRNYSFALQTRFSRTKLLRDLNAAVDASEEVVQLVGPGHSDRPAALFELCQVQGRRFQNTDSIDDLNAGIKALEELLNLAIDDSSDRARALSRPGSALEARFGRMAMMDDLDASVEASREVARLVSDDDKMRPIYLDWLGVALRARFEQTKDLNDLDAAILASKEAIELVRKPNPDEAQLEDLVSILEAETPIMPTVGDEQDRVGVLINLTDALRRRFEQTSRMDDIEAIVKANQEILMLIPKQHPYRMDCLDTLDTALQTRFQASGSIPDLKAAIEVNKEKFKKAVEDVYRSTSLNNVAALSFQLYQRTGFLDSLNDSVEACKKTIELASNEDPEDIIILGSLLIARFQVTSSVEDLSGAVDMSKKAVKMTAEDAANRELHKNATANLGIALLRRYEQFNSMEDLNAAVELHEKALDLSAEEDPDRPMHLSYLCLCRRTRFDRTGLPSDINTAIEVGKLAVQRASSEDKFLFPIFLSNLGSAHLAQYHRTGSLEDLDTAVEISKRVLSISEGHLQRAMFLNFHGWALLRLFEKSESIEDGDAAVEAIQETIRFLPEDHPDRALCFSNLSLALLKRFDRRESTSDLSDAVAMADQAVQTARMGHPSMPVCQNSLGMALMARYERTGSIEDLTRSIDAHKSAANLMSEDHADYLLTFNNLALGLLKVFERTGSMNDLDKALKFSMKAIFSTSKSDRSYSIFLSTLSSILLTRFEKMGLDDDIDISVDLVREAVVLSKGDPPRQAGFSACLAQALRGRYRRRQLVDDIDEAVEMSRTAVGLTPQDHQNRVSLLNLMASTLLDRARMTHSIDDLNRAVDGSVEAVDLCLEADIERATYLKTLGNCLHARFVQTQSSQDSERAVEAYRKSLCLDSGHPTTRIHSGIDCASLLFPQNIREGSQMLIKAIELLPRATPRSLLRNEQQSALSSFSGLGGDAAALSICAGESASEAIRLLELGRGVMAGVSFDARSDITALQNSHPELAEKFKFLRDELDLTNLNAGEDFSVPERQRTLQSRTARQYKASIEFDAMLGEIRSKCGFERFLLGPSVEELKKIAEDGPVVILNSTRFGSHAFIITHGGVRCLSLNRLSFEELQNNATRLRELIKDANPVTWASVNRALRELMKWLWDKVVEPVLSALGFEKMPKGDDEWPFVRWIPVGLLNLFPIHAAGNHSMKNQQTLDRVISSYSATIGALSRARNQIQRLHVSRSVDPRPQRALLVSMQETPNRTALSHAPAEVAAVDRILPLEKFVLDQPTKLAVLQTIQKCSFIHFACHGETNPDPSRSKILFTDWEMDPFTVADMANLNLDRVELAYLSACHAAGSEDLTLLDEALHMAGACQLAGFPVVIGSLWQVQDEYCEKVAVRVYETMLQPPQPDVAGLRNASGGMPDTTVELDIRKAALGLHLAIRQLRDDTQLKKGGKTISFPMAWAPYVCVGL